jgi:aspartate/methionine/tyrosine aminotransferase
MDSFKVAVEKSYGESDKTFLLFNFPHNPTGYSLSLEEAKNIEIYLLEQAEKGRRFVAVCDDAYWGLCYEKGTQKESLFSTLSKLHKNILAVKIDGCTKEFFMWGLRVGFISFGFKGMNDACAKALEKKTAAAIRANISNATHHSQEILVQLLASPKIYEEKKKKEVILRSRYEEVKEIVYNERFKNIWQAYPFNAGYFMCLHLKNGVKAEELRVKLLDSYGTGIISLSDHDIRITFSCIEKEGLVKFFSNLASAIEEL